MGAVFILAIDDNQYIEYITKSPGILFDPVGTLKIINDRFDIVVPIDVSCFKEHIENIHNVFNIIRFQCRENEEMDSAKCLNTLQPLDSLYKDILRDFDSISHIVSNNPSKRSAWFSGVGVVFKHIFGILDEDDAKNYNDAIQRLSNTDNKLINSIKKSIIVSQSAILNVNNSIYEININQAKLYDVIDKMTASLNNVSGILLVDNFKIRLNAALNVLQSNLLTLSFKIEDLLNSILFVKSNTIHPSILTPHQLYKDIVSNLKVVPKYRDFPVNLDLSNIHILLNIADLVCYYLDGKLVFIIKIPLVNALEYNLYKNTPLPTPHITGKPNSFTMILPSEEYLALSKDKSSFALLKNLNSCKITLVRNYICEVADSSSVSGNPTCEIEIITKAITSLPENCQFRFIYGDIDIWHKLNNDKWIFVQSKPTKISIECKNNVRTSEFIISGTGVLNIPFECVAYNKNFRLVRKIYPRIEIPSVSSDFNILNDSCCSLSRFNAIKSIPVLKIKNVNLDKLKSVKIVSDQILSDLQNVDTENNFNNHISFPILTILSVILWFSLVLIYVCKKNKYSKKFFPRPDNIEVTNNSDIELRSSHPRLRTE